MLHAIGLAVVPLAATLDRGRWLRVLADGLLALHLLTPQTWPFARPRGRIPWDLSPMVPNAIGSLDGRLPLDRAETTIAAEPATGRPAGAVRRRDPDGRGVATICGDQAAPRRRRLAWVAVAARAGAGVRLARAAKSIDPGYFDPRLRFYPPFRDYYRRLEGVRAALRPPGPVRVAYAGTNLPYYLLGPGLRNEVRYVNIDAHRDWLLHDYHRQAELAGRGPLAELPAGLGPDPARRAGLAGQPRGRGDPAPGRHPGEPRGGPAQRGRCRRVSRSSAAGPTRTPSDSSRSTARRRKRPVVPLVPRRPGPSHGRWRL